MARITLRAGEYIEAVCEGDLVLQQVHRVDLSK